MTSGQYKASTNIKVEFNLPSNAPVINSELNIDDKTTYNIKENIKIIDGNWKVYVINKNDFAVFYDVFPLAFFGILFSVLVGFFVALFFKKPSELQEIVKNQAAKIINSEIEFNTIFEQASVGITHIDYAGKFIAINKQFCQILGYTLEEIKSLDFPSLTHPDDIAENLKLMEDLKKSNGDVASLKKYQAQYNALNAKFNALVKENGLLKDQNIITWETEPGSYLLSPSRK